MSKIAIALSKELKVFKALSYTNQLRIINRKNSSIQPSNNANEAQPSSKETNQVPQNLVNVNKFEKYLIHKFSNTEYKTLNDVPDRVSAGQLNYAKDKGRARATLYLIGLTIAGGALAAYFGRRHHEQGMRRTDDINKQHAEYSKLHNELLKNKK